MKKVDLAKISKEEYLSLLKRPQIKSDSVYKDVEPILSEIKQNGTAAVIKFANKFDGLVGDEIRATEKEIDISYADVNEKLKDAVETAITNIKKFHTEQIPKDYEVETSSGVKCGRTYRAIENVGLYIPGGSAALFSTLLMLAIPAKLACCKRIVLCSPAAESLSAEILYCAKRLGINEIYKVGGAQAIGLMAYGTEEIEKVEKIFGPGNQYVTAAKNLVSIDPDGCAVDMPAGPSEVLIIADDSANPKFTAADLLSQAEHGVDSQVILLSTSEKLLNEVEAEIEVQLNRLTRKEIAKQALDDSLLIKVDSLAAAFEFSNQYAPEHLILQLENAQSYLNSVQNAGSVFLGNYTAESAGDYASGTNHSLPTYGYAKSFSGVNVLSFMKGITYQEISSEGIKNLGNTIMTMAKAEGLDAHANAVEVRFND